MIDKLKTLINRLLNPPDEDFAVMMGLHPFASPEDVSFEEE